MTLAELLQREMDRNNWSLRDVEGRTGVSRTAIESILNGATAVPSLRTLKRLGGLLHLPLWRMVELAGFDAGLGGHPGAAGDTARVVALVRAMPQLAELLDQASDLPADDLEGVLAYLEALRKRRERAGLAPGDDAG